MKKILIGLAILVIISSFSCAKKIKSPTSEIGSIDFPPTPQNVVTAVGNGKVILAWSVSDSSAVSGFRIFRTDSLKTEFVLIDSTSLFTYTDQNLKNGQRYYYKISSYDQRHFEGYKSNEVFATPGVYGIAIEGNKKVTNSRNITLSLVAPPNTLYMTIASDSLFSNSPWEVFSSRKVWNLDPPDGIKKIFAKFQDEDGNITTESYFTSIVLDTQAKIDSVAENTNGAIKKPGENIHFRLYTEEINGEAKVDLGTITGIKLYDNGSSGDAVAGDGIYELDYVIPEGTQMDNAIVTGHFRDEAGNDASVKTTPGRVTIAVEPIAVMLFEPSNATPTTLSLYWTQNQENNFFCYRIYRAEESWTDSTLIATVVNKLSVSLVDTGLTPQTKYYYKVFVFNTAGFFSGSNLVFASTIVFPEPDSVNLFPPYNITSSSMSLSWTQSQASYFSAYRVFRARTSAVNQDSTLVATITSPSGLTCIDSNLSANTTYYYTIYVYNTEGTFKKGNVVSGRTLTVQPLHSIKLLISPVDKERIRLSWTESQTSDFDHYRIYRSDKPDVSNQDLMVALIQEKETTTFIDTKLPQGKVYYYKIYEYKKEGDFSSSNTAKVF
jgi:fibronectin type 3 domain-containing protein